MKYNWKLWRKKGTKNLTRAKFTKNKNVFHYGVRGRHLNRPRRTRFRNSRCSDPVVGKVEHRPFPPRPRSQRCEQRGGGVGGIGVSRGAVDSPLSSLVLWRRRGARGPFLFQRSVPAGGGCVRNVSVSRSGHRGRRGRISSSSLNAASHQSWAVGRGAGSPVPEFYRDSRHAAPAYGSVCRPITSLAGLDPMTFMPLDERLSASPLRSVGTTGIDGTVVPVDWNRVEVRTVRRENVPGSPVREPIRTGCFRFFFFSFFRANGTRGPVAPETALES